MELLTRVFEQLLSMAATALPVMAVVLLVRCLLKRAPKKYSYALWLVVAFRLVCPVTISTDVSIIPQDLPQRITAEIGDANRLGGYVGDTRTIFNHEANREVFDRAVEAGREPYYAGEPGGYYVVTGPDGVSAPNTVASAALPVASVVWMAGFLVAIGYIILSVVRLKRQVSAAVRREWNVWECDGIPTPFVLGLLRTRIYLPFHLSDEERAYVLAHEQYHIRRLDHWAKALALGILAVYWWNPAVWLCWVLFCRDMEMSCDEAVLAKLGEDVKRGYSLSLVSFALDRRFPAALAFGEHDAVKRVKNVLKWKKAKPIVLVLGAVVVIAVAVVCGTNASTASRVTKEIDGLGVHISAKFHDSVKSWAIYEDVYQDGRLISGRPILMDSFVDDGTGASGRRFKATLRSDTKLAAESGFAGELDCVFETGGDGDRTTASWTLELPGEHYTGAARTLGNGDLEHNRGRMRDSIETGGEVLLYSVLLSTKPDGGNTVYAQDQSLTKVNDVVVQFRLVTSPYGVESFEDAPLDLAQTLYDLRVETLNDPDDPGGLNAIRTLLDAMGVGEMGEYELALYDTSNGMTSLGAQLTGTLWTGGIYGGENGLLIRFLQPEDEEKTEGKWERIGYLIQALIPDLEDGDYVFPKLPGGNEFHQLLHEGDWLAEHLGYKTVKELGQSAQGIRTLLAYFAEREDPLGDLARELFSLRADGVREQPAVARMMEAMDLGGEPLGTYTVEWLDEETVQINFTALHMTVEELDRAMTSRAAMILAVGKEIRQVNWCSIPDSNYTVYFDRSQPDAWAKNLGYEGLTDLGRTIEGLKQFLEYLGFGTETGSVDALAQSLFSLRVASVADIEHVRELLDALGVGDIGSYEVSQFDSAGDQVLHIRFEKALTDAQNVEMTDIAYLLLALVEDADRVDYAFPKENGSSTHTIYWDGDPLDNWAKTLGYENIKALGRSAGGIRVLMNYVGYSGDGGEMNRLAQTLYAAKNDPEGLLAALEAWEEPLGRYAIQNSANHQLSLLFYDSPVEPEKRSTLMWRYSMVLLALLDDYTETTWNWVENGVETLLPNDGLWNTDDWLHAHGLAGTIRDYGTSPEMVRTLLEALYPERGGGPPAMAETQIPEIFVNVLLNQEVVGHLLDDYEPYDLYYDLDTYWHGTKDPMQCYLYYTLTRAQFRQFIKELDTIPEELRGVELEGDESDVAHIAVNGYWSRGEVETFAADLRARTQLTDDTASAPNLSVVSAAEEEISAAWYEDGNFDWDYGSLPTLTLPAVSTLSHTNPYTLTLVLSNGDTETLTVGEDYYAVTESRTQVEKNTYELMGSGDGIYQLTIQRRNEDQSEKAVYFVPYQGGKFVFLVELRPLTTLPEASAPFTDILGYDGYVQTTEDSGFWQMRTYYAVTDGAVFPIAESFGFDGAEDYAVDLDGDGVKELVTNVQFGGDGHETVYVYRRVGDGPEGIQIGTLDLSDLPMNYDDWGINATAASYDPEEKVFRVHYAQKNTEEYGVLETRGLERFEFSEYKKLT